MARTDLDDEEAYERIRAASEAAPDLDRALGSGGRGSRSDGAFRTLALASGMLVLVILALIAVSTTIRAWPAFQASGISFITTNDWDPDKGQYGALAFIYGTIVSSVIALVLAVPVSVGIALFSLEVAPRRLRTPVAYVVDLLAAVPSVVYGLWGAYVFAPVLKPIYASISEKVEGWPVLDTFFGGNVLSGKTFMTAGIILAIMIVPIVTSLSREVLATVPRAQKDAALALGATRWEMIRNSMLPASQGGIVGSVMLGLGRAMGETIAVALVIGSAIQITPEMFQPGYSMAAVIANQFGEASDAKKAGLVALGVVLFGLTIIVNLAARSFVTRFDRRLQGA